MFETDNQQKHWLKWLTCTLLYFARATLRVKIKLKQLIIVEDSEHRGALELAILLAVI